LAAREEVVQRADRRGARLGDLLQAAARIAPLHEEPSRRFDDAVARSRRRGCHGATHRTRKIVLVSVLPTSPARSEEERLDAPDRSDARLLAAATLFTVAVLVHGADHLRRGVDTVGRDVFWAGTAGMVLEVAVVVLITQRHRLAPL